MSITCRGIHHGTVAGTVFTKDHIRNGVISHCKRYQQRCGSTGGSSAIALYLRHERGEDEGI